jgi:aldose 1-epimerase
MRQTTRYWNLGGLQRTVHDHTLALNCSHFLPVTPTQIPTGEVRSVEGTDFDFKSSASRKLAVLDGVDGAGQPGFDHCLVIDRDGADAGALVHCAEASCDGVVMRVATTKPGVQLYTVRERARCR